MTNPEVLPVDIDAAIEAFDDVLGDAGSFAEFGYASYREGGIRTLTEAFAAFRHRISSQARPADGELVERIARAVMVWGQPHFKHMVSFNVLCEAISASLSSERIAPQAGERAQICRHPRRQGRR